MVYCVNDVAVMKAWSLDQMVEGSAQISTPQDTLLYDCILESGGPN